MVIKKGFIISIVFWIIFDFLTISIGIYASAIIKPISMTGSPYLILSDTILPPFYRNIFYLALLSVVMSTIDSFTFVSAETIKNNFLNPKMHYKHAMQIGIAITGLLSYIIVNNFNYAIEIWYLSGTIAASSLIIPFINSVFFKNKSKKPILLIISPVIVSLLWYILKNPYGIDALYPGVISSGLVFYLTLDN